MARRPTKLQFYEHPVTCPYCRTDITITSLMETIFAARRNCPVCKKEMFVENGRAKKMPKEVEQKTPKHVPIEDLETETIKCRDWNSEWNGLP